MDKVNSIRLSIDFVRMVGDKRSYLIISDTDDGRDEKLVLTGDEACKSAEEIHKLISNIYFRNEEEA